jgi:heme exporter protein C
MLRAKAIWILGLLGALVMIFNLHAVFMNLPDDALQGGVYRIIFIHVPAALNADIFYTIALVTSVLFLAKKDFIYDSISVACIEVATMLVLVNLVTGSIWGKSQWGIWWAWDLRMTTQLMCFLLYLGYLVVRPAIAEPTQRATMSAFISIFAYADIPLVFMAIRLPNVRTQHPSAVLETGQMARVYWTSFGVGVLALLLIASALVLVRLHQETSQREIDSLRRELHAL